MIPLTNEIPNSLFLSPTDKEDMKLILSSLDISKATGPYDILTKVLTLLKNDNFDHLDHLFNLSITTIFAITISITISITTF